MALGVVGLAALLGVAAHPAPAFASTAPAHKVGAIGMTPGRAVATSAVSVLASTVLYDDTGAAALEYYAGQGGHEAIDDLHLTGAGSPDTIKFEYYDPVLAGSFSATVRLYGNPSGLDLAATPLIGTYTVTDLSGGRHIVSVPLPDGPAVTKDIWVGIEFSSTTAGLLLDSVPSVGTSHDLYLEDGSFYDFGGSPKANFALRIVDNPTYGLNITTSGSGSVAKSPDQASYVEGTVVQLTATPDPHWHFVSWGGDAAGADNPRSVLMNSDKSITATFAPDSFALNYVAGAGGTITGSASQAVSFGSNGTPVTATPNTGYHFVRGIYFYRVQLAGSEHRGRFVVVE